jgi:hypothetical protein
MSAAQMAFDQSPLGQRDAFVRWLVTIALPAAIAGRPLDDAEREALRDFTTDEIRRAREGSPST